jgi:hypothetical protein
MRRTALALASAAVLALTLCAPVAANAAEAPLQERIDAVLKEFPGGTQVGDDSVSWQRGDILLTLEGGSSARAVGSCLTGKYCAWSGTGYSGSKLTFSACSSGGIANSLAPLGGLARSLANARTSGTVHAKNGSTVVYSLGAGAGITSNSAALTNMTCYT